MFLDPLVRFFSAQAQFAISEINQSKLKSDSLFWFYPYSHVSLVVTIMLFLELCNRFRRIIDLYFFMSYWREQF